MNDRGRSATPSHLIIGCEATGNKLHGRESIITPGKLWRRTPFLLQRYNKETHDRTMEERRRRRAVEEFSYPTRLELVLSISLPRASKPPLWRCC